MYFRDAIAAHIICSGSANHAGALTVCLEQMVMMFNGSRWV
jgi:hypothetical protein